MLFEHVFRVRIVYKSGYTHDFDVTKFKITTGYGGSISYQYEAVNVKNKPVEMGANEIAAVWQIGVRSRIKHPFRRSA